MADARPHHGSEAQSASPEGSEQVDVQPFRLTSVAEGFGNKLSCLCPWGEALLVGLADGGLLVFQRKSTPAGVAQQDGRRPSASGAAQWHAARVYRSFGRKAILQLLTIQHTQEPQQQQQQHQNHATSSQAEFLLSLSDDGLNVLSLPKMSLICEAPKSRGALCFSWDASRSLLAVATRRRVYIHHFNGKDVIELKDFPVPDMVSSVCWASGNLCVGLRRQYCIIDVASGAVTDVAAAGRELPPQVLAIPGSSELLLLRDHLAVFAGHNGAASRRLQVQWSATPLAVCLAWPYAVAMMPTFIEVRNVHRASTHAVVQQIQQDELGIVPPCVSNDGTVFVGSRTLGTIAALCSTPFLEQAQQLGSAGLYQEALLMCEIADEGDAAAQRRKEALQDELRMWYGMRLFRDGEWDEGMAQLGRCSHPDPLLLLHLFPALVPSELLVGLPSCIPDGARGAAYRAPQGDAYVSAVTQLLPYLWSHHSRLSSVLQDAQAAAAGPDGGAPRDGDGQLPYQHLDAAQQRQLAEVIDTAILKALLATEDFYALGRFAQRTNRVSLLAGQQALQDAGRYKELTDLLWSHGRHQDALQLLDLVATAPSQLPQPPRGPAAELHGVAGAWAGVKLLVSLVPADMELIQANASWILGLDPDSALPLFLETQPPVDPAGALQVLRSAAPASCAAYLEEALARGVAVPQIAHEELVQLYLEAVTGRTGADGSPLPAEEAARKLKHLVCVSPHIAVESLLWKLPSGRLHDIRALLLGRSGRYSEALGVYVHQLQDIRAAESLCDTVYVAHSVAAPPAAAAEQAARAGLEDDAAPGQPVEELDAALVGIVPELTEEPHRIYLMLLLAVLDHNPPGRYGARNAAGGVGSVPQEVWEAVVRLLSRKRERLDPLEVLDLLPEDELTVAAFMQFLNSTMRAASQQRRHLALLLQLCRSEHLQVAAQLAAAQQQYVVVEPERCCVICRKRIGLSALMRHPGGDMVHYGCFQRQALAASRSSLEPAADSGPHPFSVAGL